MRKLLLFMMLAMITAAGAVEIKKFELDKYQFAAFNVEAKSRGDGAFELTILPTPGNWPMIHITPPAIPVGVDGATVTLQQIYPVGPTAKRLNLVFQPPEAAAGVPLRDLLGDNRPHTLDTTLQAGKFTHFSVNAHSNDDKIVLLISRMKLRAPSASAVAKARLEPLPAVRFQGRPFFPIGAWDLEDNGGNAPVDPGFLAAGGNIAVVGYLGLPGHPWYEKHRQPVLYPRIDALLADPAYRNLAFIIGLDSPLVMDASEAKKQGLGGYHKPVTGDEITRRTEILTADLRRLRKYPNVLGYQLDEPENLVWPYYKKNCADNWAQHKDNGLAEMMQQWLGWVHRTIRQEHPEAKLMPVLGWWTTYEPAKEMYDILMPNAYPKAADLAEINYDAAMAVGAARRNGGGRTVIYVPAMFDNLPGGPGALTRHEQRYACFAPLTRGAMGVFGWRMGRCSRAYRDNVIFPVLKEVSALTPYFLGEWHDELVSSDRDTATAPYLQAFKERVRLMAGEADGEIIKVKDAVPDVSYCLRRDPATGKYLLLAVSNRREPMTVTFQLGVENLPPVMTDVLDLHQVRGAAGRFSDEFAPFAVHAYVFEPTGQGK